MIIHHVSSLIGRVVIPFLVFAALSSSTAVLSSELPFSIAVYRSGDITLDGPKNLTAVREMGFDAYYYNAHWAYEITNPGWHQRNLPPWIEACEQNNMTFIAGQYYTWGGNAPFDYATAVDQFGNVEPTTPSPVSTGWWEHIIEEGAVYLANLSLHYPIWGAIWDVELYDHDAFKHKYYSYDDEAIRGFANDTGADIPPLSPGRRRDWLRENGLLEDFQSWEENRAYELAKGVAEKVHAINPNFVLGFFPVQDVWFHWALLRGFGTPEAPAGAWTGWQTYGGISEKHAQDLKSRIREQGIDAQFVVGIGGATLTNFEQSVRRCEAFWVYTFGNLGQHFEDLIGILREHVYFGRTHPDILPECSLGPDIAARPYRGPDGQVTLALDEHEGGTVLKENITILTQENAVLIGERNLTEITLASPNPAISTGNLPCLVSGITELDLYSTEFFYLERELAQVLDYYHGNGLGDLGSLADKLELARQQAEGNVSRAVETLLEARESAYEAILETVTDLSGEFSPPPEATTKFWLADLKISKGQVRQGRMYLYDGLSTWYSADESLVIVAFASALGSLVAHLSQRKPSQQDHG